MSDMISRPKLFTPLTLRGITLPNRTVVAPMVQYRARDGIPGDFHFIHLGKFALGRFGVVMTEATAVEARGRVTHQCPGIWNDSQIAPWRRIADTIRAEGSVPAIQLAHAGRKAATHRAMEDTAPYGPDQAWPVVGPTTAPTTAGHAVPHALTASEIAEIVDAYVAATHRAEAAGFDIVEIHGAHGYLLASFLSPISNTRNDQYGGAVQEAGQDDHRTRRGRRAGNDRQPIQRLRLPAHVQAQASASSSVCPGCTEMRSLRSTPNGMEPANRG